MKTIGMVVGETSGDMLGASLMKALRVHFPACRFVGIGGPRMIAEGFESLHEMERLSVMGFVEPLSRLPELFRMRRHLIQYFSKHKPDVFVGIDAPAFTIGLEFALKKVGIRTVHYVSPSVWAWRPGRIKKIKQAVDLMLTLFPFETAIYRENNVPHCFVGHSLADSIPLETQTHAARVQLHLPLHRPVIAVLPGSRRMEVGVLAEPFIRACAHLQKQYPETIFVVAMINAELQAVFQSTLARVAPTLAMQCVLNDSHTVMAASDGVLLASGTATLEALLLGKPMVVAYKMSPVTYRLAKWLVKIPFFSLPNLLAGEALVPELLQHEVTPERLANAMAMTILHPEQAQQLRVRFREIHLSLRQSASEKAAEAIAKLLS